MGGQRAYTVYDNGVAAGIQRSNGRRGQPVGGVHATDSPMPSDRPWLRLGVWNVGALDTLKVVLIDDSYHEGDRLCVGDAMIHAIWPTVSIRSTSVTVNPKAANANDYIDWVDACQGISPPIGSTIATMRLLSVCWRRHDSRDMAHRKHSARQRNTGARGR